MAQYYSHNCDHYVMQSGRVGRMQVLSTIPVHAGDVINFSADLFLRFSPMRKAVEIPSQVDLFAFYAPHRWYCPEVDTAVTGEYAKENSWNYFVRRPDQAGSTPGDLASPPAISGLTEALAQTAAATDNMEPFHAIGQGANLTNPILLSIYQSIWRVFFRDYRSDVAQDDETTKHFVPPFNFLTSSYAFSDYDTTAVNGIKLRDFTRGLRVAGLISQNTMFNRYPMDDASYTQSGSAIDLDKIAEAGTMAKIERESQLDMPMASDVLEKVYNGYLDRDAEKIPWLIAHSKDIQVAKDVDGTGEYLGTSTGKSVGVHHCNMVQKLFPEHGYIMIIAVVRFPNIGADMTQPIVKRHPLHNTAIAEEARSDPRHDLVKKNVTFDIKEYNTARSVSGTHNNYPAPGDSYRMMPHRCSSDFEFVPGSSTKRQGFPVGIPDTDDALNNLAHVNEEVDMFLSREFQDYRIMGMIKCERQSTVFSQYESHMAGTIK